jgi:hypothetical protein
MAETESLKLAAEVIGVGDAGTTVSSSLTADAQRSKIASTRAKAHLCPPVKSPPSGCCPVPEVFSEETPSQ